MKRNQPQQPNDFQLNSIAEKIPIHFRNSKRVILGNAVLGNDLGAQVPFSEEEDPPSRMGSAHQLGHNKYSKTSANLPGDKVTFTENLATPGVPIVFRTQEERASNPDRLNLDRRKLTVCPLLEGEEHLRLLNYQHNAITRIQHLSALKRLIFLDLYDNQIEEISGLSSLRSLRVLMLGKNRIKKIDNLEPLTKLDVLDLHGNQISKIENLNHLTELRVLNLAGNLISHVDQVMGMYSLAEFNLRRNKIRTVTEVDVLPHLQRLFLSFNEITCFEDIQCLSESISLSELSLDGNPLCQDASYRHVVLKNMQQLKQLDMKNISEEERRQALLLTRKEEERKREMNKLAMLKEKKRLAITNARRQWELMQGSGVAYPGRRVRSSLAVPELVASHIGSVPNSELVSPVSGESDGPELVSLASGDARSRPSSAYSSITDTDNTTDEGFKLRVSSGRRKHNTRQKNVGGGDSVSVNPSSGATNTAIIGDGLNTLAQLEGDTLSLYGLQSLEAFDRNWGVQAAGVVTVIIFKFMDFDAIVSQLSKIRVRFPATQTLVFCATNIHSLQQINALCLLRRLDNLTIDLDGNPVTKLTLWRLYTVFRLAHFCLKKINDIEVSAGDVLNAEKLFGPLSHAATCQLPPFRLLSFMGDPRRKQMFADGRKLPDPGKLSGDKSQTEGVGRAGLVYLPAEPQQDPHGRQALAQCFTNDLAKEALHNERKRTELMKIWPSLITEMVHSALAEMTDMNSYMKKSLQVLEKS